MKVLLCLLFMGVLVSVSSKDGFSGFKGVYPMGDQANIRYMTSLNSSETILFEANPVMRYSFYNNFIDRLMDTSSDKSDFSSALYIVFKPQLRMYTEESMPVKMPSYRVQVGWQMLKELSFRLTEKTDQTFLGFSLEHGHYSNGQTGGAFAEGYSDGSPESNAAYDSIGSSTELSEIVNRINGNFSTNLTEFILSFKSLDLDNRKYMEKMFSLDFGYTLYHKFLLIPGLITAGGFSDNDIDIYGRHRLLISGEYASLIDKENFVHNKLKVNKIFININIERILGAHDSINPFRYELKSTLFYTFFPPGFGIITGIIYGHDNYNLRFVDDGFQFFAGFTWENFSRIQMQKD